MRHAGQLCSKHLHAPAAGRVQVMGAPVAGSGVRATVSTGGGLTLKGLLPSMRSRRLQMIFPLAGPLRRGLVSLEAKKRRVRPTTCFNTCSDNHPCRVSCRVPHACLMRALEGADVRASPSLHSSRTEPLHSACMLGTAAATPFLTHPAPGPTCMSTSPQHHFLPAISEGPACRGGTPTSCWLWTCLLPGARVSAQHASSWTGTRRRTIGAPSSASCETLSSMCVLSSPPLMVAGTSALQDAIAS